MQVAFEAASGLVGGGDDTRPGGGQLCPRLGVRDGGRDEVGEIADVRFGAFGNPLPDMRTHHQCAAHPAVHDQRGTRALADTEGAQSQRYLPRGGAVVLDPGRRAGALNLLADAVVVEGESLADRPTRLVPDIQRRQHHPGLFGLEADQRHMVDSEAVRQFGDGDGVDVG